MAVEMAIRASATPRPSLPPSPSPSLSATTKCSLKPKFRPTSVSLPTSTISLLALFTSPFEAQAFSLSKDQIVSSLTEVNTFHLDNLKLQPYNGSSVVVLFDLGWHEFLKAGCFFIFMLELVGGADN